MRLKCQYYIADNINRNKKYWKNVIEGNIMNSVLNMSLVGVTIKQFENARIRLKKLALNKFENYIHIGICENER